MIILFTELLKQSTIVPLLRDQKHVQDMGTNPQKSKGVENKQQQAGTTQISTPKTSFSFPFCAFRPV